MQGYKETYSQYKTCFMFIWTVSNFIYCGRIKYKQTNFAFSYMMDVSLVLPTRQDDNLKHSNNTAVLDTSPPPLTDFKS